MTIIKCPSGLEVEARPLQVKELQKLADPALARGGRNIDLMLSVAHRVVSPGPYPWEPGSAPRWADDALVGDRFSALIDVRAATWGPEYDFTVRCGQCKKPVPWTLDLRDLTRKAYPKETIDQIRNGIVTFHTEGPAGEDVTFVLMYGRDEKAIEKYMRTHSGVWGLGDALRRRIREVEDVGGADSDALGEWIDSLDALDARALVDRMDAVDGGVDTDIEIVCQECDWQQEITLPFDKTFFAPKRRPAAGRSLPEVAREIAKTETREAKEAQRTPRATTPEIPSAKTAGEKTPSHPK